MVTTPSYFRRLSATRFQPTELVIGAWSTTEQHIAPTIGLLTHLIEIDRDGRRDDELRIARLGCEILGVLTLDPVDVTVRAIRPGRTIELVEAELRQNGRVAVTLRSWLLQRTETSAFAGVALDPLPSFEDMPPHDFGGRWPGHFVGTVEARRAWLGAGRAQCWVRPRIPLLEDEPVSATARMMGIVDIANGLTPRAAPEEVFFPNVDLFASLLRDPEPGWVGLDIRASIGPDGGGITESVLHDEQGPMGTITQTLTVRPR